MAGNVILGGIVMRSGTTGGTGNVHWEDEKEFDSNKEASRKTLEGFSSLRARKGEEKQVGVRTDQRLDK